MIKRTLLVIVVIAVGAGLHLEQAQVEVFEFREGVEQLVLVPGSRGNLGGGKCTGGLVFTGIHWCNFCYVLLDLLDIPQFHGFQHGQELHLLLDLKWRHPQDLRALSALQLE